MTHFLCGTRVCPWRPWMQRWTCSNRRLPRQVPGPEHADDRAVAEDGTPMNCACCRRKIPSARQPTGLEPPRSTGWYRPGSAGWWRISGSPTSCAWASPRSTTVTAMFGKRWKRCGRWWRKAPPGPALAAAPEGDLTPRRSAPAGFVVNFFFGACIGPALVTYTVLCTGDVLWPPANRLQSPVPPQPWG